MHEMEQTEPLLVPAVEVVSKPGRIERLRVPTWALVRPAVMGADSAATTAKTEVECNGTAPEAPRRETCIPQVIRLARQNCSLGRSVPTGTEFAEPQDALLRSSILRRDSDHLRLDAGMRRHG